MERMAGEVEERDGRAKCRTIGRKGIIFGCSRYWNRGVVFGARGRFREESRP